MDLEPVRAATVPRARLRHSDHQTLSQATRLAGCAVLLVDHAHPAVLAFRYARRVVVGSAEERLRTEKETDGEMRRRFDDPRYRGFFNLFQILSSVPVISKQL